MYAYKLHLNSTILSPVHNGCVDFIIEMANALHLMGNASELDKLIQSFGKSIMVKKILFRLYSISFYRGAFGLTLYKKIGKYPNLKCIICRLFLY